LLEKEKALKAGGWPSIVGTYAFGVVGVASVAKVIPLRIEIEQIVGATAAEYAWLIALLGVPAALFAGISGAAIDRVGPRATLIASGLIGAFADALYWVAPSIGGFQAARLVEGVALVGIFSAGPALLMATTAGRHRIAAMTFWSTYTPTGFSLGLLLGGAFAGSASWRLTFASHGCLMVLVASMALALPRLPPAPAGRTGALGRLRELAGAYRPSAAAALALVFFLVISVGFGTSTILPSYVARAHQVTLAQASRLIAGTNLSMIAGALIVALLLARGARPRLVMAGLAAGAIACGTALFWPGTSLRMLAPVLCLWFLFMGGGPALLLAVLPRVAEPARRGAAAGLLSQASAIATFVNPPLWLALFTGGDWRPLAWLIAAIWVAGTVLLSALHAVNRPEAAAVPAAGS
jgi:MFS family permease